jgi:hypothetical protein
MWQRIVFLFLVVIALFLVVYIEYQILCFFLGSKLGPPAAIFLFGIVFILAFLLVWHPGYFPKSVQNGVNRVKTGVRSIK